MTFKKGHCINKGRYPTKETKKKMSINHADVSGNKNPMYGKFPNKETLEKMSESHRGQHPQSEFKKGEHCGKDHPNWKGGITPLNRAIRTCAEMTEWKSQIRGRDNWTCRECGCKGWMEAHHIKSISNIIIGYNITTKEEAIMCDELWNLDNGITYCKKCHKLLKGKGGLL